MKPNNLTQFHANTSWDLIKDMSPAELDLFLESQGHNLTQVRTSIEQSKMALNNKAMLANARKKRLRKAKT